MDEARTRLMDEPGCCAGDAKVIEADGCGVFAIAADAPDPRFCPWCGQAINEREAAASISEARGQ